MIRAREQLWMNKIKLGEICASAVKLHVWAWLGSAVLLGCGGTYESATRDDLGVAARQLDLEPIEASEPESAPTFDGSLSTYLAYSLNKSPEARAAFQRWRAAMLRISRARRLPEPKITYGYFIRSVETRVGPQRQRFGLKQAFPWPTKLTAGADAASLTARAAQRHFEARLLTIKMRVANAYWYLWLIHEEHRLKAEHDIVLETLAGSVRGRVKVGAASLADLNQVELDVSRHHDHHGEHHEAARAASSELLATIGAAPSTETLEAKDEPESGLPTDDDEILRTSAHAHPRVEAFGFLSSASDARARAEGADRLPSFQIGLDYIQTDEASAPGVPGSGKDAVILGGGLSVPLWQGNYKDAERAARADAAAYRADRDTALQETDAELEDALSSIRDAERRIKLHEDTLIPQAETTFQSVLGSYQTGRSTVAAALLAQRDLLELRIGLAKARADHARAWARLEHVVGREVSASQMENRDGNE